MSRSVTPSENGTAPPTKNANEYDGEFATPDPETFNAVDQVEKQLTASPLKDSEAAKDIDAADESHNNDLDLRDKQAGKVGGNKTPHHRSSKTHVPTPHHRTLNGHSETEESDHEDQSNGDKSSKSAEVSGKADQEGSHGIADREGPNRPEGKVSQVEVSERAVSTTRKSTRNKPVSKVHPKTIATIDEIAASDEASASGKTPSVIATIKFSNAENGVDDSFNPIAQNRPGGSDTPDGTSVSIANASKTAKERGSSTDPPPTRSARKKDQIAPYKELGGKDVDGQSTSKTESARKVEGGDKDVENDSVAIAPDVSSNSPSSSDPHTRPSRRSQPNLTEREKEQKRSKTISLAASEQAKVVMEEAEAPEETYEDDDRLSKTTRSSNRAVMKTVRPIESQTLPELPSNTTSRSKRTCELILPDPAHLISDSNPRVPLVS